jgi:hypothetical protein
MINHKIHELKIDIGTHPVVHHNGPQSLEGYDAILDVSDSPTYNIDGTIPHAHHYAIDEWNFWGFTPFYWAVKLLDHYTAKGSKIYLHCYAGKHRSVMIGFMYLQSLGYTPEEAAAKFDSQVDITIIEEPENSKNWLLNFYEKDVKRGRIHPDTVEFMKLVRKYPEKSCEQVRDMMLGRKEGGAADLDMHVLYVEKKNGKDTSAS